MPTSARHDDEQTGERLAALTRQGRDAMPEQGCDGEPFANTPTKKTQASPKSTRKELAAQGRRRLEKKASRKSRGDCTIAHLDIQHIDRKAASTQDIVTTWLQSNPKKNGSKSWERYERYKKSMTIRQALKNGCTWLDLQFDHAHGNLKIRAAAPVTDNDSKNKKHGPKLERASSHSQRPVSARFAAVPDQVQRHFTRV